MREACAYSTGSEATCSYAGRRMTLRSRSALRTRRRKRTTCARRSLRAAARSRRRLAQRRAHGVRIDRRRQRPGRIQVRRIDLDPTDRRRARRTNAVPRTSADVIDRSPAASRRAISMIGALAVAIHQQIGLGIEQDRTPHFFRPIIEMRDATQRCLDAADDYRHLAIGLARALRVHDHRTVGPLAADAARCIGIVATHAPVGGVAIDQRVHVAGGDAEEQPRRT